MKIYCFSGLGADERVFVFLKLNPAYELVSVDWIKPLESEALEDYSIRISEKIQTKNPFGILGVSFGGVVAQEVSKIVKPKFTLLISSINSPGQIPFLLKLAPDFMLRVIPAYLFKLQGWIANYIFSAQNKRLLQQILHDTDPRFVKWALIALKNWKPNGLKSSGFFISGLKDRILKPADEGVKIPDGGHFMVVDLSNEVSKEINLFLESYMFFK
tara:strand:- start:4133 stop:4777 length:645 start_codon:yes stop_codon:yes gene_type:complete